MGVTETLLVKVFLGVLDRRNVMVVAMAPVDMASKEDMVMGRLHMELMVNKAATTEVITEAHSSDMKLLKINSSMGNNIIHHNLDNNIIHHNLDNNIIHHNLDNNKTQHSTNNKGTDKHPHSNTNREMTQEDQELQDKIVRITRER